MWQFIKCTIANTELNIARVNNIGNTEMDKKCIRNSMFIYLSIPQEAWYTQIKNKLKSLRNRQEILTQWTWEKARR